MTTTTMPKLLIATGNPGKARELAEVLEGLPLQLTTLTNEGIKATVEETGATLEENALLKARAYSALSHLPTLADDSGLEVNALNGEPGVYAKRYAGENATDQERVQYLLTKLQGVPWERRVARFRAVIAVVLPSGREQVCEGIVEGLIALDPTGEGGFGYDPIFYLPQFGMTMAELPLAQKNSVSHRGQAAREAVRLLQTLMKRGELS